MKVPILSRLFGGRRARARLSNRANRRTRYVRVARGSFDVAQTTDFNKTHWSAADELSPNAASVSSIRKTVRERARYEVCNNTYARGMTKNLADWTIGTGPRIQVLIEDDDAATRIERRFMTWAKNVKLARKLWTMRVAKCVDGEAFAVLNSNPKLPGTVQLDFNPLECDLVTTPIFTGAETGPNKVDGIIYDDAGNPVEYHVLRHHPGNEYGGSSLDYDPVDAAHVIHLFTPERSGQRRGVSEIMAALPLFAQLRRYTLAVLGAAESVADWALVLGTESAAYEDEADSVPEALDEIELTPRMLTVMPAGWKPYQIRAEMPPTTYGDFKREILNEIGRVLSMPYYLAACNAAGYNFASAKVDGQSFFRMLDIEREQQFEAEALDGRIVPAWIREDRLAFPADYATWKADRRNYKWLWPGVPHQDPSRDGKGQELRLKNRVSNLAAEWGKQGRDWEPELLQIHREQIFDDKLAVERAKALKEKLDEAGLSEQDLALVRPKQKPGGNGQPNAQLAEALDDIEDRIEELEPAGAR